MKLWQCLAMLNMNELATLYQVNGENLDRSGDLGVGMLYSEGFCDEKGRTSTMSLDERLRGMNGFANQYLA